MNLSHELEQEGTKQVVGGGVYSIKRTNVPYKNSFIIMPQKDIK